MLFAIAGFTSCKKDDDSVFNESPDERLNKKLNEYQTLLSGAQNGWKAFLTTDSAVAGPYQGTYHFFFRFDNANRVRMYSDWDSASAVTSRESSYRLKALQQPSLLFDTYSYIHLLSDPDPAVSGGDASTNTGLFSDFEFYFDSSSNDYISLVGRFNRSRMTLVRASQQEAAAYDNKELGRGLLLKNINKYLNYFKRITIGGVVYEIKVDIAGRRIFLSWLNANGVLQTFTTKFYYSIGGITFGNPLVNGGQTITGFTNLAWNAGTTTLTFTVNGSTATVVGVGQPIRADLNAPRRWWQFAIDNGNAYWASLNGFHVNGVDDAYNVRSLTSGTDVYFYMIYWPEYDPGNDLFAPVFLDRAASSLSLAYATAPRTPTFTSDGRAIFSELGTYGTHPATGPAALSRTQLYSPNGYYFVQTGQTTYDMVSALDGKAWITWEF